jgi:dUTPase
MKDVLKSFMRKIEKVSDNFTGKKEPEEAIEKVLHIFDPEVPVYKFALREDLKDEPRFLPTRAYDKDTGWDVRSAPKDRKAIILRPSQKVLIPLGFRSLPPNGWWFQLAPRSSSFTKRSLHCLYGTIEECWEGELCFACQWNPDLSDLTWKRSKEQLTIEFGEAIGQIIPVRRQEMIVQGVSNEEIDRLYAERKGERGIKGFGSSDNKERVAANG